jgi:TolB-like protein
MGNDKAANQAPPPAAEVPPPVVDPATGFWARAHEHKIIQWGIGYLGAALALAHGQELVGHAFHWPDVVTRIFMIVLIIGFPISLTFAWYHGHRGLKQMSAGELAIVSVLLLIGAVFFTAALPSDEHAADVAAAHDAPSAASDVHADGAAAAGAAAESSSPPSATERPVLPNSVAVLPLENLSADRDSALYALGMHAEIISQLTKLRNVSVIGRDSVLPYAANRPSPERIAADLNVKSLLVGTFQAANGRIRIAMQLVDPATRTNLWSDEYQSNFEDVFAVQADISMNVANALAVEFSVTEQQEIEKRPTSSADAYALFLQAEGILDAAGGFDVAHSLLDRAIELDPTFARAHGTKAAFYAATFINTVNGAAVAASGQADLERLVRSNAERALALDPSELRAHSALRTLNILTWRWSTFERSLAPGDEVRFSAPEVWVAAWMGRRDEARRIAQKLYDLNPGNGLHTLIQYVAQSYAGDHAGSMQTVRRALDAQPANSLLRLWLGFNHILLGDDKEAFAELQSVERQLGDNPPIVFFPELAYAYSRLERPADARRVFDQFRMRAEQSDPGAGAWAVAYWAIGDKTQTLHWLDVLAEKISNHEVDPGLVTVMNFKMDFLDDPALNTPELQSALSRITGE